jgi:replicative DNA helicase
MGTDDIAHLRVPPQSVEAESSVLGSFLLDNRSFDLVADILRATDFYRYEHRIIFECISDAINAGQPADVITVSQQLHRLGKSDEVGGLDYLHTLAQYVPGPFNVRRYAELVREKAVLRMLLAAGDLTATDILNPSHKTTSQILEEAEQRIYGIAQVGVAHQETKKMGSQLNGLLERLQQRADGNANEGIHTGFVDLDVLIDGLGGGDFVVIAGRPSMGKTTLATDIAQNVAVKHGLPVLFFSLEMSAEQLTQRMVGAIGHIDQKRMRDGSLTSLEWEALPKAIELLHNAPLEIQDQGVETVSQLRAVARRVSRRVRGLGLIVVDYLQLMQGGGGEGKPSAENRATEVAQISRGLKLLAKELNCPVIALSQLNRGVEQRQDKRPMMSDLRESGAIEQDADVIMFVYRDEVYTKEACKQPGVAEIIVAKQRNGPIGTVKLTWLSHFTTFENLSRGGYA